MQLRVTGQVGLHISTSFFSSSHSCHPSAMTLLSHAAPRNGDFALEANFPGTRVEHRSSPSQPEPSIPLHPLGIKPLGNQFLASGPNARESAGALQALPDEILAIFLEYLDPRSLRLLGYTCKFLYAFCTSDDLWKALFLE